MTKTSPINTNRVVNFIETTSVQRARLRFPHTDAQIRSEKHVHHRIDLVHDVHAERVADHRVPLGPVLLVEYFFDFFGRFLPGRPTKKRQTTSRHHCHY